ncbi:MAG: DUF3696 domain-containing protein [Syntrophomonas sp.]
MITNIKLNNFKCFGNQIIKLAPLTLFTGLNNSGKSTVFQALRMISRWRNGHDPILSGHGGLYDLKNKSSSQNSPIEIVCELSNEQKLVMYIDFSDVTKPAINKVDEDSPILPMISYLSADRWGPRVSLPLYTCVDELTHVGEYGEYVIDYLTRHERDIVPAILRHPEAEGETLEYNVRAWLGEISPNVNFKHASELKRDSSYATLDGFRPTNTGFGLSYALPIIVAILGMATLSPDRNDASLTFKKDSLVLIENPEAHLHPKGQMEMGMLLAKASQTGVQVLVESHSDHILNGLRIAVHDGVLPPDDANVYFFSKNSLGMTDLIKPTIDKNGRIDVWPNGFFDEWDKALDKLLFPAEE